MCNCSKRFMLKYIIRYDFLLNFLFFNAFLVFRAQYEILNVLHSILYSHPCSQSSGV